MTRLRLIWNLIVGVVLTATLILCMAATVDSCVNRCSRNADRAEREAIVQEDFAPGHYKASKAPGPGNISQEVR